MSQIQNQTVQHPSGDFLLPGVFQQSPGLFLLAVVFLVLML